MTGLLNKQADSVNFVWNYCNDRQKDALRFRRRSHTGFDLINLTSGCSKELGLHSGTVNDVCQQYAKSRAQIGKAYLRYRGKNSLGWVPLKGRDLKREGEAFRFCGSTFKVFFSRPLPLGKITDGTNFSRDRRGNWFLNVAVQTSPAHTRIPVRGVGVDLGLKNFATLSTGEKVIAPQIYRKMETSIKIAQRAHKTRRIRVLNAKSAYCRHDFLHKLSNRLVQEFDYIVVGHIHAGSLIRTHLGKSIHDASWHSFCQQLAYKAIKHGAWFEEVSECFTTQICSNCGNLPDSRPRGIADLGIREWQCCSCGISHDRDVNAALNILRRGRATLAVGTSAY